MYVCMHVCMCVYVFCKDVHVCVCMRTAIYVFPYPGFHELFMSRCLHVPAGLCKCLYGHM